MLLALVELAESIELGTKARTWVRLRQAMKTICSGPRGQSGR